MRLPAVIRDNLATVVAGVLVACAVAGAFLWWAPRELAGDALVARIHDADGGVHELPLDRDGELVVETALGRNVIAVVDGAAYVREADCPRGDCLRQGPISRPGEQLICLPHRLWVEVVEEGADDGELDSSAVKPMGDDARVDFVSG